jgi:tetratricopeptide (TPR) repeat protein
MIGSAPNMIGRRYQIVDKIGSGGMGQVYRVIDRLTGQHVALKNLLSAGEHLMSPTNDALDLRLALAQEFRLLASLRHPHVIDVLDYGFDTQQQPYFTMQLMESAQTIIDAGRDRALDDQVQLVVQVLQALAYLHRRGIIHRDLKPNNVMVDETAVVKVLDFGLSITHDQKQDTAGTTAGTLAYIAPEVLLGAPATELSDLYAVGVMAYELFAGRHPFETDNAARMVHLVLQTQPDFLSVDLAPALIYILDRLMAKQPDERFATALDVMDALNAAIGTPLALETSATRESFLQAAGLVGREEEIRQLSTAFNRAVRGSGSTWLIAGESGIGKTRLLDEIGTLAMVQGALVLRGQSFEMGGEPYHLWRPVLRWLTLLTELSDADLQVLHRIIPDLAQLIDRPIPDGQPLDGQTAQTRLLSLVEKMLRAQQQPVVLILEDLQWVGSESLVLLTHLTQVAAHLPLLILGSVREDERPDLAEQLAQMQLLRLERLSPREIARLSEIMLGSSGRSEQVIDLLQRETEGNVFFVIEVVRALAEEAGQLAQIGSRTLPAQVFAGGMQRIIQRRLQSVSPADRPLLRLAAAAGRQIDPVLLRHLAGGKNIERWLRNCARAAVLEAHETEWRFAHDKLRTAVLEGITAADRAALHHQVMTAMEVLYADQLERFAAALAYHAHHAGDTFGEAHYAALAGAISLRDCAYREALGFFERALLLVEQQAIEAEARLVEIIRLKQQIGDVNAALGRYAAAYATYEQALVISQQSNAATAQASLAGSMGDVAYAMDNLEAAQAHYRQSLALFEALADRNGIVKALNGLGTIAYDLDDEAGANTYFGRSLALSRKGGSQWGMAGSFADADDDLRG